MQLMATSPAPVAREGLALAELVRELSVLGAELEGAGETRVRGVRQDSREVTAGDLFVARPGTRSDGARFVADALERGAVAVLAERGRASFERSVPSIWVDDAARGLAFAAEAVYGFPSRALPVIGITGTNGKTTTAHLVERALSRLGQRPARLGTLGFAFAGVEEEGAHTTPEADAISRRLADVVRRGGTELVMEVSSHALALGRVAALRFDVAAFSNLSQDHLDFHGNMAEYGAVKERLFRELSPRSAVINVDDAFGKGLAARVQASRGSRVVTVSSRATADVCARATEFSLAGVRAELLVLGQELTLESRLVGAHNLDNLLLALGILLALDVRAEAALEALAEAEAAPGRLERCDAPDDQRLVVIDYAHTPDALTRVLSALRPLTPGKLACVFGCGGDRDPEKRPLMGRAVAEGADFAIVTNDNPRSERPEAIAQAILPALVASGTPHVVELDRRAAIQLAISRSAPFDTVLIAGKGHENYQILGQEKRPFDDRLEARRALERLRSGRVG